MEPRVEMCIRDRRGGATVILICGNTHAPLARLADIVLRTVNYEALLTTVDFTFSKISATLIIEVIYSFLLSVPVSYTHLDVYKRQPSGSP